MRWICCALAAYFAAAVITGARPVPIDIQPTPMTQTTHTTTP